MNHLLNGGLSPRQAHIQAEILFGDDSAAPEEAMKKSRPRGEDVVGCVRSAFAHHYSPFVKVAWPAFFAGEYAEEITHLRLCVSVKIAIHCASE
jgi:hypothetical protein